MASILRPIQLIFTSSCESHGKQIVSKNTSSEPMNKPIQQKMLKRRLAPKTDLLWLRVFHKHTKNTRNRLLVGKFMGECRSIDVAYYKALDSSNFCNISNAKSLFDSLEFRDAERAQKFNIIDWKSIH